MLDPNEDADVVHPYISQPTASLNILNYSGNPNPVYTNNGGNQVVMNFERETFRVNRDAGAAVIYVQTFPRVRASSYSVNYTIDSQNENINVLSWNTWSTVAGADYAVPGNGQAAMISYCLRIRAGWHFRHADLSGGSGRTPANLYPDP